MSRNNYGTKVHLYRWFNSSISNVSVSLTEGVKPEKQTPDFFSFITCHEIDPDNLTTTGRYVSLRASFEEMLSLKHAIRLVIQGNGQQVLRFAITSSPNTSEEGDQKRLTVEEKSGGQGNDEKFIALVFRDGTHFTIEHVLDPPRALAMMDVLEFVAKKGLEMDLATEPLIWSQGHGNGAKRTGKCSGLHYPPQGRNAQGRNTREISPEQVFG